MKARRKTRRSNIGYQRLLNRRFFYAFVYNLMITVCVIAIAIIWMCLKNVNTDENNLTVHESSVVESSPKNDDNQVTVESSETTIPEPTESEYHIVKYGEGLSAEDEYLLAKIAEAEAENQSLKTKVFIILTVLNRVYSDEFPNTVNDVLFHVVNGVHQFTPIADGRWYNVEPDEECREAVKIAKEIIFDHSFSALYFESDPDENWHSRNLTFVCESDDMQFWE